MELESLYQKVFHICVRFAVYRENAIIDDLKDILPELQSFVVAFTSENIFGIEKEDYQLLRQLLLDILQDLLVGLEQRDVVLLEDTVEFGLKVFIELFFEEEELLRLREGERE